ncbi:hypothetical protein AGIG_G2569 [Arapaima gigas]
MASRQLVETQKTNHLVGGASAVAVADLCHETGGGTDLCHGTETTNPHVPSLDHEAAPVLTTGSRRN